MNERIQLGDEQYKRAMVVIFVLTLFVQILDTTIVNVAIPTLADAFAVSDTQIDRAIIAYLVGLAVFIPTSAWLAERFGFRRVFLASLTLFTVASGLCGASQSLGQLVVFRTLQGVGAGVMGPLGAAMLYRAFPQNERAKAATAVISVAVLAPAIGPVLGGFIVETVSWRWIFLVNIPVGAVAFVAGALTVRDFESDSRLPFDRVGFLLAGTGLGATLFGVTVARDQGWSSPIVLVAIAVGVGALVALPLFEQRQQHPLLDFGLFAAPIFRSIQIVAFPTFVAFMGVLFLLPLYLQTLRGFSPLESGLATFPQAIGLWFSSQLVGRVLYARVGPRRLLFIGLTGAFVVGLFLARIDLETQLSTIRALMFIRGFAIGFTLIAVQTAVYAQTSVADTAQATALFGANRQSAPAFGIALAATVLSVAAGDLAEPILPDYQLALLISALVFLPAIVAVWWVRDEDAAATLSNSA